MTLLGSMRTIKFAYKGFQPDNLLSDDDDDCGNTCNSIHG